MAKTWSVYALIVAFLLSAALIFSSSSGATVGVSCNRPTSHDLYVKLPREYPVLHKALRDVFGTRWVEAAIVSFGESRWYRFAGNGQYIGYFQMGDYERRTTKWTSDVYGQLRASKRWNDLTGGQWRKWDCRP